MKRACIVHDAVNAVVLPLLVALTAAGLLQVVDPRHVTHALLAYTAADFVWVALQPEAVPSLPAFILFHHVVTAVLLAIPLMHPHLHWYTCVDGIVELNTCFLIARRTFPRARRLLSVLYWSSFILLRILLYPLMVPVFWYELQAIEHAPAWHTAACVGSQVILCLFNFVLLGLSVQRTRSRSAAERSSKKAGKPGGAAAGSSGAVCADAGAAAASQAVAASRPASGSAMVRLRARAA